MTPLIPPPWAPRIWLHDGQIIACLPNGGGHTIKYPNSPAGLSALLTMLASRTALSRLGEPGDPTQHNVSASISALEAFRGPIKRKEKPTEPMREGVMEVLRRLEMI